MDLPVSVLSGLQGRKASGMGRGVPDNEEQLPPSCPWNLICGSISISCSCRFFYLAGRSYPAKQRRAYPERILRELQSDAGVLRNPQAGQSAGYSALSISGTSNGFRREGRMAGTPRDFPELWRGIFCASGS